MPVSIDSGFPVTSRDTAGWTNSHAWPAFTTPGANRLVVAIRLHNGSTVLTANTFTSPNLTWTKRVSAIDTGVNNIAEIWTAWAAVSVSSEVITETYSGGNSYSRGSFVVFSLAGSGSSGVGATANSAAGASDGDPSLAIVATAANSLLLGGLVYRSSGNDTAVDGSTTSQYTGGGGGGFGFNERVGSRVSASASSHTIGFTGDDVFGAWQMAGIEILEVAQPPDPTLPVLLSEGRRYAPFKPGIAR